MTMTERMTIWDPLRRKYVALTPEEEVRQWFIRTLHEVVKVPMHMMMSEAGFKLGEKHFRADILIYGRDARPIAVVECKRPDVDLDRAVADQTLRYDMVLEVQYIFITNGDRTLVFRREGKCKGCGSSEAEVNPALQFIPMTRTPLYEDMLHY